MKPIIKGDGTTHWYECRCGTPINPNQAKCPVCGTEFDWEEREDGDKE